MRRWDSERELYSRRHYTRTRKYNRLVHKLRHRSFSATVHQIQWNNVMQRPLRRSCSFKVTDFGTNRKFLLVINTNLPPILHRFRDMLHYWSNFQPQQGMLLFNTHLGWTQKKIQDVKIWPQETRNIPLLCGATHILIGVPWTIYAWLTSVTERLTRQWRH